MLMKNKTLRFVSRKVVLRLLGNNLVNRYNDMAKLYVTKHSKMCLCIVSIITLGIVLCLN